jgi:hypothetical protein
VELVIRSGKTQAQIALDPEAPAEAEFPYLRRGSVRQPAHYLSAYV